MHSAEIGQVLSLAGCSRPGNPDAATRAGLPPGPGLKRFSGLLLQTSMIGVIITKDEDLRSVTVVTNQLNYANDSFDKIFIKYLFVTLNINSHNYFSFRHVSS